MDVASNDERRLVERDPCSTPIASILGVVDFARSLVATRRRAALLATEHRARLTLLHVVDPAGFRPLRDWLGRPADVEIKLGQAKATLDRLVVVGAKGANPLRELLLGTPAEGLLRTVRRPLLLVRRAARQPYRRALVPLDFAACSGRALQCAARIAPRAALQAFHAIDASLEMKLRAADVPEDIVVDHRARARQHAYGRLHALAAEHLGPGRVAGFAVRQGDAASLIVAEEGRIGADLVVIGQGGHSALASFLLGSVSQRVLRGVRCDTLVVPRPSSPDRGTRRGECAVAGSVLADRWARHLEALREEAAEEQAPR
jgi:nucleotide-binding universal stress UspA family protein